MTINKYIPFNKMGDSKVRITIDLDFVHDNIDEETAKRVLLKKLDFSEYVIQDTINQKSFNILIKSKNIQLCK